MFLRRSSFKFTSSAILLISGLVLVQVPAAYAATVVATGTDPAICNQEVSDATNVTVVRLAGGDCVISFNSGSVAWTVPSNLKRIKVLLVGGGGGGGGSYDTAGAGGGGAGQALLINAREITAKLTYQITVGNGGAGGFHIARTNSVDAIGVSGSSSSISLNGSILHTAFGGGGGGSSRANGPGTASRVGGAAATLSSGGVGGVGGGPGGGGYSGGGGGGSSGTGANGSTTSPGLAVAGGTGTSIDISGTAISYGVGGAGGVQDGSTNVNGVAGAANTGNGGSGASVSTGTFRNGGAGGSGVVIIRYSTTAPTFSNLSISGNVTTAILRQSNTISATVNVPSLLTFFAGKTRIAGCISIPTSGSSTNNVATCAWKPTVKGPAVITVEATPVAAGISSVSSNSLNLAVVARATRR